jgi:hypothetical protein
MGGMAMDGLGGGVLFLSVWTAMMVTMMVPATLPLILFYRTLARKRLSPAWARISRSKPQVQLRSLYSSNGVNSCVTPNSACKIVNRIGV